MTLLPNEQEIVTSNGNKVILTNLRIQMNDSNWGSSYSIEIFHEDISYVETRYKSNIVFLILGCLGILYGLYAASQSYGESLNAGFILGAVFLIMWWFSRRHVISISSDGGSSLNFEVGQMSREQIDNFISKVQTAKLRRVNQLHRHTLDAAVIE